MLKNKVMKKIFFISMLAVAVIVACGKEVETKATMFTIP